MSNKLGSKIDRLNPTDTYPLVDGDAVTGFTALDTQVKQNQQTIDEVRKQADLDRVGPTFAQIVTATNALSYPLSPQGNYVISVQGLANPSTDKISLPNPTGNMIDGALLTVINNTAQTITIDASNVTQTLDNQNSIDVGPDFFRTYQYNHASNDYITFEDGYIPSMKVNTAENVIATLKAQGLAHTEDDLKSDGFIQGIGVNTQTDVKNIEFSNATVTDDGNGKVSVTTSTVPHPETIIHHFKTITDRDAWSNSNGTLHTSVVAFVDDDGNGTTKSYEWNGANWIDYNVAPPVNLPTSLAHYQDVVLTFKDEASRDTWTSSKRQSGHDYVCLVTYGDVTKFAYFLLKDTEPNWTPVVEPSHTTVDDVTLAFTDAAERDAWIPHRIAGKNYTGLILNETTGKVDFYVLKDGATAWQAVPAPSSLDVSDVMLAFADEAARDAYTTAHLSSVAKADCFVKQAADGLPTYFTFANGQWSQVENTNIFLEKDGVGNFRAKTF